MTGLRLLQLRCDIFICFQKFGHMLLHQRFNLFLNCRINLCLDFIAFHLRLHSGFDLRGLLLRDHAAFDSCLVLFCVHLYLRSLQYRFQHLALHFFGDGCADRVRICFYLWANHSLHLGGCGCFQGIGIQLSNRRIQHFSVVLRC